MKKPNPHQRLPRAGGRLARLILAGTCIAAFATTGSAAIIADADFEDDNYGGDSATGTGNTGLTGNWTVGGDNESFLSSAGGASRSLAGGGTWSGGTYFATFSNGYRIDTVSADLATAHTGKDLWFGYLFQAAAVDTGNGGTRAFLDFGGLQAGMNYDGGSGSDFFVGSSTGGSFAASPDWNLVVGKLGWDTAQNKFGSADLWVNPDADLTSGQVLSSVDISGENLTTVDQLAFEFGESRDGSKFVAMDRIVFAEAQGDLPGMNPVPEPSLFAALAGLAGMALVVVRRRRAG